MLALVMLVAAVNSSELRSVMTKTDPPFKIYLHDFVSDSWLSKTIYSTGRLHGLEEAVAEDALRELLRHERGYGAVRVLDIGANIGYMSLLFASKSPRVHVDAFEPFRTHRHLFRKSVRDNGFGDRISIHSELLGNESASKCMRANPTNAASTAVTHAGCEDPLRMARLDDVVANRAYDLLKIDVEGYEPFVFDGAKLVLAHGPKYILLEWIPWRITSHFPGYDAVGFIASFADRYSIRIIEHPHLPHNQTVPLLRRWQKALPDGCNILLTHA